MKSAVFYLTLAVAIQARQPTTTSIYTPRTSTVPIVTTIPRTTTTKAVFDECEDDIQTTAKTSIRYTTTTVKTSSTVKVTTTAKPTTTFKPTTTTFKPTTTTTKPITTTTTFKPIITTVKSTTTFVKPTTTTAGSVSGDDKCEDEEMEHTKDDKDKDKKTTAGPVVTSKVDIKTTQAPEKTTVPVSDE
jgi:hypothetical protein